MYVDTLKSSPLPLAGFPLIGGNVPLRTERRSPPVWLWPGGGQERGVVLSNDPSVKLYNHGEGPY